MFVYTMPPVVQAVVQPVWQPVVAVNGVLQCFSECVLRAVYTERASGRARIRACVLWTSSLFSASSDMRDVSTLARAQIRARALVVWTALYCLSPAVECQTFVAVVYCYSWFHQAVATRRQAILTSHGALYRHRSLLAPAAAAAFVAELSLSLRQHTPSHYSRSLRRHKRLLNQTHTRAVVRYTLDATTTTMLPLFLGDPDPF